MNTYKFTFANGSTQTVPATDMTEARRKVFGRIGAARLGRCDSIVLVTDAARDRAAAVAAYTTLPG